MVEYLSQFIDFLINELGFFFEFGYLRILFNVRILVLKATF